MVRRGNIQRESLRLLRKAAVANIAQSDVAGEGWRMSIASFRHRRGIAKTSTDRALMRLKATCAWLNTGSAPASSSTGPWRTASR